MKRMCSIVCLLVVCLLTGCASAEAQQQEPVFTAETAAATASETQPETTIAETTALPETETVVTTVTEIATTAPVTEPVTEETPTEPQPVYETFSGILIDADCADFDDPPAHDLPCMLMDTCRASGYGLDVQQADGTWIFIPFDENGQDLAWAYLTQTARMDNLNVSVTGTLADGIIAVQTLTEIE